MERSLETRYRLLAAAFRDAPEGAAARKPLGAAFDEALSLLIFVLSQDLSLPPPEIDRQHLTSLLGVLLPGRLEGHEAYRLLLPDLLEAFLLFAAREEGLSSPWDWSSAIEDSRAAFQAALRDPARPRPASLPRRAPDRRPASKLGRNAPCFCGSGRKYKHCCLRLA